jgi:hypothetical protein
VATVGKELLPSVWEVLGKPADVPLGDDPIATPVEDQGGSLDFTESIFYVGPCQISIELAEGSAHDGLVNLEVLPSYPMPVPKWAGLRPRVRHIAPVERNQSVNDLLPRIEVRQKYLAAPFPDPAHDPLHPWGFQQSLEMSPPGRTTHEG